MPIDPRIPLMGQPVQPGRSPLEMATAVAQLGSLQAQAQDRQTQAAEAQAKRQREAQVEAAMREAVTVGPDGQPTVDYAKLLPHVPPQMLFQVKKEIDATAEQMAKLQTANLTRAEKVAVYMGGVARGVAASGHDPKAFALGIVGAQKVGALTQAEADALLDAAEQDPSAVKRWADGAIAQASASGTEGGFTLGPGQVRYGPGGEQIATGPPSTSENFTLSPGSVRFGPGGEQIAGVPATPPAPRDERLVQIIGADGKPVWARESQAVGRAVGGGAGGDAGGVKLSPAAQQDIADMLTVQDLGKEALTLGEETKWEGVGPVSGRLGPVGARWLGRGGEKAERLRNLIGNVQGTIAKLRGGTAFSAAEQTMLERYTPTVLDSPLQIRTKLKSLNDFITTKRENTLRVAGGQYTPRDTPAPPPGGAKKVGRFEVEVH